MHCNSFSSPEASKAATAYPDSVTPMLDPGVNAGLYFGDDGYLRVSDGDTWVPLNNTDSVSVNEWHRITTRFDYSSLQMDVWLNGVQLTSGVDFVDDLPEFKSIQISQIGTTPAYLDDLIVSTQPPQNLLPYLDGFESYQLGSDLNSQGLWSVLSGLVTVDGSIVGSGGRALKVSGEALAQFDGVGLGTTWIEMKIYPSASSAPPSLTTDTRGAFYFDSTGLIHVADGNHWTATTTTATLGQWQDIAIKADYNAQTWQLWLNSVQVPGTYAFGSLAPGLSLQWLMISDAGATYIDEVSVDISSSQ